MKDGKKNPVIFPPIHPDLASQSCASALRHIPTLTRSFHQIFGEQTPRPTRSSALNTKVKAGFFGYERGRPHSKLGDVTLGNVPIRDEQAYHRTMEVSFNLYIYIYIIESSSSILVYNHHLINHSMTIYDHHVVGVSIAIGVPQ